MAKSKTYETGQKIFHPFYGIGTIKKTDVKKEILGETKNFSVVLFKNTNMEMMLNLDKDETIQTLIKKDEVPKLLKIIKNSDPELAKKYSRRKYARYKKNLNKIKSGNIYEMAEVIRDLESIKSSSKRLSSKEKKLLERAMNLFVEMICEVKGIEEDEAREMFEDTVA